MIEAFEDFVKENGLFSKKTPLLLAISGGKDSMCLSDLLLKSNHNFDLAHCNFKLRGNASDSDEQFLEDYANSIGRKLFKTAFKTQAYAEANKVSIQMAARDLRYNWLKNLAKKHNHHFILTAHHKNDSVETVLINLINGTGISGLHGILTQKEKIVRPLLFATRKQIDQYVSSNQLIYREDASNEETKYLRNKIRLDIIPQLQELNPNTIEAINGTTQKVLESEYLLNEQLHKYQQKFLKQENGSFHLAFNGLKKHPAKKTILYHLLSPFGFEGKQLNNILNAFDAEPGKTFLSPTHRMIKDRTELIILPIGSNKNADLFPIEIAEGQQQIKTGSFELKLSLHETKDVKIQPNKHLAFLDANELQYPLKLRKWQDGDYFYPFGMQKKKKKLKKFLIDEKVALHEKENIYVLTSEKKIVWVVGYRIDERFKVNTNTQTILQIEFMPQFN